MNTATPRPKKATENGKKRENDGNVPKSAEPLKKSGFKTPLNMKNKTPQMKAVTPSPGNTPKIPIPSKISMRKSSSSMEFRPVKHRQMNMMVASPFPYDKKLAVSKLDANIANQQNDKDEPSFYCILKEDDPNKAGMKIFNFIMLRAWRSRRDEVKNLTKELTDVKRSLIRTKNELHVINSLYHVESSRNEELIANIRRVTEELQITKSTCENFETTADCLKMDKIYLKSQLESSEMEARLLNENVNCLQSQLEEHVDTENKLRHDLEMQSTKLDELENRKNEFMDEICELSQQMKDLKIEHEQRIQHKESELETCAKEKADLQKHIQKLGDQLKIIPRLEAKEEALLKTIQQLKSDVEFLQRCLGATIGNRVKNALNEALFYPKTTVTMLHWMAYYLLPATPPPPKLAPIPFSFSLRKALSIVRR